MRDHYPRPLVAGIVSLLLIANTFRPLGWFATIVTGAALVAMLLSLAS